MVSNVESPRPVQVFLDTPHFIESPEPRLPGGYKRDFFKDNDQGFKVHRGSVCASLHGISQTLQSQKDPIGFIHVQVREEALAKSHRPIGSLFNEAHKFALVGGGRIGEMVFQATPDALDSLGHTIMQKAELTPRRTVDGEGISKVRVSGYRSEVGAIKEVALHGTANRVMFSAEEALAWLAQPNVVGNSYLVELFRLKPMRRPSPTDILIETFRGALAQLPSGIVVRPFLPQEATDGFGETFLALSVQLVKDPKCKEIALPSIDGESPSVYKKNKPPTTSEPESTNKYLLDLSPDHHQLFLDIVGTHPLVRKVELSPMIEAFPASASAPSACPELPTPKKGGDYPIVGIIDGGVANIPGLATWRASGAQVCRPEDLDETHGTFIAGLVAAGAALNPHIADGLEPQGCKFFDLDLFPRRDLRQQYYGDGPDYFFDLLDETIKLAKQNHGVRVFNFSYCLQSPSSHHGYSLWADRLDRIARINDVILVVSAGNLPPGQSRPPWPVETTDATTMLASISTPQQITPPAEHLLGLTIGAINPPGIEGHEAEVPTTYTRRGPGTGRARKPDLAHFGGTEQSTATDNRTGLASLAPNGDCVECCGTSFACPNASAMLATLDHRLEHAQPRELLLALSVHRASRTNILNDDSLRHIARDFVGFGLPPPADTLLVDSPSAISLIFNGVLRDRQQLVFPFVWPAELVRHTSQCRGRVDLTLALTPPIDPDYQDEAMRVQLEAYLHQEKIDLKTGEFVWESRLNQDGSGLSQGMKKTERYLLKTGLKWSPIKHYTASFPRGRSGSSNWRLLLKSLTRAGALYPSAGVPFAVIFTLSDPKHEAPIHDSVCNSLRARGHAIADITVAHRARIRQD